MSDGRLDTIIIKIPLTVEYILESKNKKILLFFIKTHALTLSLDFGIFTCLARAVFSSTACLHISSTGTFKLTSPEKAGPSLFTWAAA